MKFECPNYAARSLDIAFSGTLVIGKLIGSRIAFVGLLYIFIDMETFSGSFRSCILQLWIGPSGQQIACIVAPLRKFRYFLSFSQALEPRYSVCHLSRLFHRQ